MKPVYKLIETNDGGKFIVDSGAGKVYELTNDEFFVLNYIQNNKLDIDCDWKNVVNSMKASNCLSDSILNAIKFMSNACVDGEFLSIERFSFDFGISSRELLEFTCKNIDSVCLELTHNCNFRCDYCCYGDNYKMNRNHANAKMNIDVIDNVMNFAKINSEESDSMHIGFYGGEPLLEFELIKYAVGVAEKKFGDKNLTFGMTTNGFLLADDVIDFIANDERFFVTLSMDGPIDVHDRYRKRVDGGGTFEVIYSNLQQIQKKYPDLLLNNMWINVVLAPPVENMKVALDFFETDNLLVKMKKQYSFVDNESGNTFFSKFDKSDLLNYEFFWANDFHGNKKFDSFRFQMLEKKFRSTHRKICGTVRPISAENGVSVVRPHGCCIPLKRKVHVSVDGNLLVCENEHTRYSLGDVWGGINGEKFKRLIDEYLNFANNHCSKCWAAFFCKICYTNFLKIGVLDEFNFAKLDIFCDKNRKRIENNISEYLMFKNVSPDYDKYFGGME